MKFNIRRNNGEHSNQPSALGSRQAKHLLCIAGAAGGFYSGTEGYFLLSPTLGSAENSVVWSAGIL